MDIGTRFGDRAYADRRHGQLPALGANGHRTVLVGPDLVRACLSSASRLASRWPSDHLSGDACRRRHQQPRLPRDRHRRHDHRALAALLPAELRSREAAAFRRSEMGEAGHAGRRSLYRFSGGRHDAGGQFRLPARHHVSGSRAVGSRARPASRPFPAQQRVAADGECRRAWDDRHLACQRLGPTARCADGRTHCTRRYGRRRDSTRRILAALQ